MQRTADVAELRHALREYRFDVRVVNSSGASSSQTATPFSSDATPSTTFRINAIPEYIGAKRYRPTRNGSICARSTFGAAYMASSDHECGTRSAEYAQQRLRVEQIRQVKSMTEPAVNRNEKLAGFRPPSLIAPKAREACAGAQLKQPGALPMSERNGLEKTSRCAGAIPNTAQKIAVQPERLGL